MVSFVKPNDVEDLILKVNEVLNNYEEFTKNAKKGAQFVSDQTFTDASVFILNNLNKRLFS